MSEYFIPADRAKDRANNNKDSLFSRKTLMTITSNALHGAIEDGRFSTNIRIGDFKKEDVKFVNKTLKDLGYSVKTVGTPAQFLVIDWDDKDTD